MKPLHFLNFKAVRKGDIVCGVNRDLQTEGRTICHTYLYIYIHVQYIYIYLIVFRSCTFYATSHECAPRLGPLEWHSCVGYISTLKCEVPAKNFA